MKKKGFTLIELLAVIVILAVLALILTPMIQDLILNARKSAFDRSIDGILSAAEYYQIENPSDETIIFTCNGISCEDSNGHKLIFKGEVPISGTITISETGVVAENLCNQSFCGSGSKDNLIINIGGNGSNNQNDNDLLINNQCTTLLGYRGLATQGKSWEFNYYVLGGRTITDGKIVYNYGYTGNVETFVAPLTGTYKLEAWGAQGGSYDDTYRGGYGGYSTGTVTLTQGETLYIVVGGNGSGGYDTRTGGFNGGGNGAGGNCNGNKRYASSGGGATHIATELLNDGLLSNYESSQDKLLIVAGGGGGSHYFNSAYGAGANGGGYIGNTATWTNNGHNYYVQPTGGSQNGAGTLGYSYSPITYNDFDASFGQGGNFNGGTCQEGSGGGGGFYGGGAGQFTPGGGGSGYIDNDRLDNKTMYCYGCTEDLENTGIHTISTTGANKDSAKCPDGVSINPVSNCAKKGTGYVKITYQNPCEGEIPTNMEIHSFIVPKTGTYKLEVWGAQGGTINSSYVGGNGGYSTGEINLTKGQTLYIAVGSQGASTNGNRAQVAQGGFNGGGNGYNFANEANRYASGGGGATHIALNNNLGELKNYADSKDDILIAAGGGGGVWYYSNEYRTTLAGHGGGLSGTTSTGYGKPNTYTATGGTQDSGSAFGQGEGKEVDHAPGGGGGYYGGNTAAFSAGGGSGYIGTLENSSSIAGNEEMPTHDGTSTMNGNQGNGYAKITFIR